ncbi:MAG: ammonia-forming cytochrome c nitrite reductase subunit c552 [Planctomycetota bacterium]|jgi:predicted CXXCH cytochrome family protein
MSRIFALLAMLAVAVFLAAGLSGCDDNDPFVLPQLTSTPAAPGTYSEGSQVCQTCHQAIYQTWEKSRHTKKVRVASLTTIVNDADSGGTNDFVEGGAGVTYNVGTSPPPGQTSFTDLALGAGIEYPMLGWDGINLLMRIGPNTYIVTYVLGGTGKWKQRYMITIDNQEYMSPVQYNDITRQYVWYHPEHWYTLNPAADTLTGYLYGVGQTPVTEGKVRNGWQRRCIGCHVTGVADLTKNSDGEYGLSIADMLANEQGDGPWFAEMPIACEACHGPAQRHVELGGGIGTALNPNDMAADRADEVCGSCHTRGSSKNAEGFGYPWAAGPLVDGQYRPGDVLDDFYNHVDRDGSRFWDDGGRSASSHHQQWIEHASSPHGKAGVTCWQCHDPHGSNIEGDLKAPVPQLCLSCHDGQGDIDSADLSKHTRHKDPETQACNNCHFNLTAKSGIKYDINTHTYRIIFPAESVSTPGLPNSCAKCHTDDSPSQLTARLAARWPNVHPVAFASSEPSPSGTGFNLLGGQSFDPLGGSITYQWSLKSGPPSFSHSEVLAATAETALFVPAAPGLYTFSLVVTNRDGLRSWVAETEVDVPASVVQTPPDITLSFYVGSDTCAACHRDTHTTWEVTRHTQKVRRPDEGAGVVFADTNGNDTTDWMEGGFNLATGTGADPIDPSRTVFDDYVYAPGVTPPIIDFDGTNYTVEIGPITYDVTWVLGGTGKWKQRYMATIGQGEYILPNQYNELTNEWVNYHVEHWYTFTDANGNGGADPGETLTGFLYNTGDTPVTEGKTRNSWQRRCTACHVTGARDMTRDSTTLEYAASINTMLSATSGPRIAETGVACEACHGPGSQHTTQPSLRGAIINPSKLSALRSNEVCGACHNRGSSVNTEGFGFPWGPNAVDGYYIPSLVLDAFYTPVPEGGKRFWDDPYGHSSSHHQQWLDMRWSAHFTGAGMTCATCHTGHAEDFAGQLKVDVVTQCGTCHKDDVDTSGERYENHSRHPVGVTVCSDCHMPFVAKSAIKYDIRAHSFQIIWPEATTDTGIPNSCTDCHPGDTPAELQGDINMLWGDLLPYAEPRAIDPSDSAAKRDVTYTAPVTVTLDGTKSYDRNGQAINAYAWTLLSAPAGSSATLSNRFASQPTIDVTVPGTYTFSLVARDLKGSSRPAKLTITVN